MTIIRVDTNLHWRAERGVQSGHWIGFCDALGITTEADSLDELHTLIPEAIHILMIDLVEDGELDGFLADRGWDSSQESIDGDFEVRVPWYLVANGTNGQPRQAH